MITSHPRVRGARRGILAAGISVAALLTMLAPAQVRASDDASQEPVAFCRLNLVVSDAETTAQFYRPDAPPCFEGQAVDETLWTDTVFMA